MVYIGNIMLFIPFALVVKCIDKQNSSGSLKCSAINIIVHIRMLF